MWRDTSRGAASFSCEGAQNIPLGRCALSKAENFRDLFEETGYHLTDKKFLFDSVPFILEEEKAHIKQSIQECFEYNL